MRHYLKFPKQPSFTQYLLLFPLLGFLDLKNDIKYYTIEEFTTGCIAYLFLVTLWCSVVGGIIYIIYAGKILLLILVAILLGIVFLLVGIPRIIYKLANRKPEK